VAVLPTDLISRFTVSIAFADPNDRHVLAAAIKGRADLIATVNLMDFPAERLDRWGIAAQHPDEF
jgi:hypothetical protein